MQKITPFLWFDGKIADAVSFYTRIFPKASVINIRQGGKDGEAMSATIVLEGQQFHLFNGGPMFSFSPAISFFISCNTQDEIDHYWNALSEGGKSNRCGWVDDKFGVTWQVVPAQLGDLLNHPDPAKAQKVLQVMLGMNKLIISELEAAAR